MPWFVENLCNARVFCGKKIRVLPNKKKFRVKVGIFDGKYVGSVVEMAVIFQGLNWLKMGGN